MRFLRLRRRRAVEAARSPLGLLVTPNTTASNVASTVEWRSTTSTFDAPIPTPPPEENPMSDVQRKLYRQALKREHRTAGQLAARAGLSAADGSGRGVVREINALVESGQLVRHGSKTPYGYTRAA